MNIQQMSLQEILQLKYEDLAFEPTDGDIRHVFEVCDALWLHSGDPATPHAALTAGHCSDGFVDVLRALRYTQITSFMAAHLVRRLRKVYRGPVDWVIGSDHAGATLSFEVARQLGAQHDFTEKGPNKTQFWRRLAVASEEWVLQVEELSTTLFTFQAVRAGVRAGNPTPVTFVPHPMVLVHRSSEYELEGEEIIYGAHFNIRKWKAGDCPLCKAGSRRITEVKKHWAELTQKAA